MKSKGARSRIKIVIKLAFRKAIRPFFRCFDVWYSAGSIDLELQRSTAQTIDCSNNRLPNKAARLTAA
ncbi:hypothetical protein LSTR_LSTR014322 [Laodelphax striatellus]|uniref:Uncharacterized protein n=1 Tax=Laodelphax striatellus TaxID=195883 RepID=A0A482X4A4_LAOST|nr:hypothetical protein LSTR_LSTR015343 [Laodelphax striatellus]RZF40735.1 hypothetical protein LSTR_LSTR014322 [Laodelphax striatellus]